MNKTSRLSFFVIVLFLIVIQTSAAGAIPGGIEIVSVSSTGEQGTSHSKALSISPNGRYVAFEHGPGISSPAFPSNGYQHIFLRDHQFGSTTKVSVDSGEVEAIGTSSRPIVSADGRYVAFVSEASNLVGGDTNNKSDIFLRDMVNETTIRISVDANGNEWDGISIQPSMSDDGRYIAYASEANNPVDPLSGFPRLDVLLHDRDPDNNGIFDETGAFTVTLLSVTPLGGDANESSSNPSIAGDGKFVAFRSGANNLTANDSDSFVDIFVRDVQSGTTSLVSVSSSGAKGDSNSFNPSISDNGRFVAFHSGASNLAGNDTNDTFDVFLHDRQTGKTVRVSVSSSGAQGNAASSEADISGNGRFIVFESHAGNLVNGDINGVGDIFVHDRLTAITRRVSIASDGTEADNVSGFLSPGVPPGITYDGHLIAFDSLANNLVAADTNTNSDIFLYENQIPAIFTSNSSHDGWILESTETGNKGGTLNKSAATLNVGDDSANRQYRVVLSFNTATLTANAVITKVTLKVKRQGVTGGGNPITLFGGLMVDIKKGTFGTSALQLTDFNAKGNKTLSGLKPTPVNGWYSINITAARMQINKTGITQIRLRFKLDDNNNSKANFLKLFSGNAPAASRPQLIVEYYVP